MDIKTQLMMSLLLMMLSACSTQPAKQSANPVDSELSITPIENNISTATLTKVKKGKTLKLVRMMEGGACNNSEQGVVGVFSLYANPEDILRIRQTQGAGVFADFESLIEAFSMRALQQAVEHLSFQNNTDKFSTLFVDLIADDIAEFEEKTTLMIDVVSQPDSLKIFQRKCQTPHNH